MSEDNTEIGGEAQEAPSPFKLIQHTKEDVSLACQNHGANTEEFLAVFTSRILNNMPSFRGKARYLLFRRAYSSPPLESRVNSAFSQITIIN